MVSDAVSTLDTFTARVLRLYTNTILTYYSRFLTADQNEKQNKQNNSIPTALVTTATFIKFKH